METVDWMPSILFKPQILVFHNSSIAFAVVTSAASGTGVTLYFSFAMNMAIALCVMSVLSLPSLVMIYSGTGIAAQDRDALGLYKYTLGRLRLSLLFAI